jgi:hypothetical protein
MPRIRTVKPEYPRHRKTRSVCRDARLLNIHLWNLADDEGRLQELPQWIIGEVYPDDEDVSPGTLREWLQELSNAGLIHRYEVSGERYIQCHDFNDHQAISHPRKSDLPPLEQADSAPSAKPPGTLPEPSAQEGKGMEGNREGNGNPKGDLPNRICSILQGGLNTLDENDFGREWPTPKLGTIASLVADVDPEFAIEVAEEVRRIVQAQDRAPNITGLYEQKFTEAKRENVREVIAESLGGPR